MKYELDWTRHYPNNGHFTSIAILTGLTIEEITAAAPSNDKWGGQKFVETFRKLGFNVNPRWNKFDEETEYPCLIRFKRTDVKEPWWYQSVYYDHQVFEGNSICTFKDWQLCYPHLKITSMLQVWI